MTAVWKSDKLLFFADRATAFIASSSGPACLKSKLFTIEISSMFKLIYLSASFPETRLVTSSGKFNITLDMSIYFRAMIAIGSSTLICSISKILWLDNLKPTCQNPRKLQKSMRKLFWNLFLHWREEFQTEDPAGLAHGEGRRCCN